jgi:hypothetical protein
MVKGNPRKGVIPHEIRVKGALSTPPTEDVLSEGERRVVSLAAFLADITGRSVKAPVVFDDPVSSLDEDFEEAVAKRLAKLTRERQVIVFTHRLSLVRLLSDFSNNENIEPHQISVERTPEGCGNPEEPPFLARKPVPRINELIDDVQRARKAAAVGRREYDDAAQRICVRLRKTLEQIVEQVLLQGVVLRFRKGIQTDGRLSKLARLNPEDCKFLDGLMTKYSYDLHEQAEETPRPFPSAAVMETDLQSLLEWLREYDKRPDAF